MEDRATQRCDLSASWFPRERCHTVSLFSVAYRQKRYRWQAPEEQSDKPRGSRGRAPWNSSLRRVPGERVFSGGYITIKLTGRQLGQLPLVPVMIVVVEPIINIPLGILEAAPGSHLVGQFILHVPIEAFLRRIVPAVAPAGHALPQS